MGTLLVRGFFAVTLLLTFVFPAWAQDSKGIGVVTALTGRASLKRLQAPETPLKLRDNLFVRDVVDTQKESLARILLMGKSTVTVRELSRFEIREEVRPDGSQRALINLAEGKIRVMVARRLMRPGDEVEIRTPNAIAAVRGSDGVIEVSKLPDGRPQTVITGVSGEFQLTLPTTPPFIANGREFQDGPALAGGAPSVLIAMAETASDAGSGLQVAQLATGLNVTALLQARITGAAGAQTLAQAFLTQAQVGGLTAGFRTSLTASGFSQPPPGANDKIVNTGAALAATAALTSGVQPGLGGGTALGSGGGGGVVTPPTPITPVTTKPIMIAQIIDLRISVLVYDQKGLADFINGLGSGSLFRAVSVPSSEFLNMTTGQINGYKVLMVGDSPASVINVTSGSPSGLLGNNAVTRVGNAVTGNQVVTGLHAQHILDANLSGGIQFLTNALQFAAAAGAGKTGLVATTDGCLSSCTGGTNAGGWITATNSFLQSAFSGKVVGNQSLNDVRISDASASHPVNSGIQRDTSVSPAMAPTLSNWNNSAHSTFTAAPAGYGTVQTVKDGSTEKILTVVKPSP